MGRLSRIKEKLRSRQGAEGSSSEQSVTASSSSMQQHASSSTRPLNETQVDKRISSTTDNLQLTSTPATDRQDAPASLPEKLWKAAYSALEQKEPEVVKAYEEILLKVQEEWNNADVPPELEKLEQSKSLGSCNMWRLIYTGLKRSKRQAELKESVSSGLQIVDSIKGVVDKAVKYSPGASVVWAGASLGLEILANPMKEPGINRKGITHVLSRMEWYWNLADLVLNENSSKYSMTALRATLQSHIIDFYKKLLLFQMQSACLYYRNWASILLRDTIKLDDWAEKLTEVKEAENRIRQDIEQYKDQETRSSLQEMEKTAASQEQILTGIYKILREEARLREKSEQNDEDKKCLKALFITDPRDDREAMQEQKGTPLVDSYGWILRNPKYQKFLDDPESRVLWINGLPGKGKTMLVFGLLDELSKTARPLPFFLCQANVNQEDRSSLNAVLRGLIYMLVEYQPSLMAIIRPHYEKLEEKLFSDSNSIKLKDILKQMLQDPSMHDTILAIDAVDECKIKRPSLTKLIVHLSTSSKAKWIVSSRDWPEIGRELAKAKGLLSLNLGDEDDEMTAAVNSFIMKRVDELAADWGNDTSLRDQVFEYMQSHADNTFLWVSLVCERLSQSDVSPRLVMDELRSFPQSLKSLYNLMLNRISESREAGLLKEILALVCVVYRPIGAEEIKELIPSMAIYKENDVKDAVGCCGSFITYQRKAISFVHQSAKEFLLDEGRAEIFADGMSRQHSKIFLRSLECMKSTLRQNLYDLQSPGTLIDDVVPPDPDPLISIKYACLYWANHLLEPSLHEVSEEHLKSTYDFLRKGLLYWLESLSLLREISVAVKTVLEIESILIIEEIPGFKPFIRDARRFIQYFKPAIKRFPLQVYISALTFSPQRSHIRELFRGHAPIWITAQPQMPHGWEAYHQSLYIAHYVTSVDYSPDGKFIAVQGMTTSEVYEVISGDLVFEVKNFMPPVVFSPNNEFLAVGIGECVGVFQTGTFDLLQKLEYSYCLRVLFMPDSETLLLKVGEDIIVLHWKTQEHLISLSGVVDICTMTKMLPDGDIIAISPKGKNVSIWNTATGTCKQTLDVDTQDASAKFVACSANGNRIAVATMKCINVWDLTETSTWIQNRELVIHLKAATALALSADGKLIIAGLSDGDICIFDSTGTCVKTLKGHSNFTTSLSLYHRNKQLASGSFDGTVKLWDISSIDGHNTVDRGSTSIETSKSDSLFILRPPEENLREMFFSPGGRMLVSYTWAEETKIWYTDTGFSTAPLVSASSLHCNLVSFTFDDKLVAVGERSRDIQVWDTTTGEKIRSFPIGTPMHIFLSPDGKNMAVLENDYLYGYQKTTGTVRFLNLAQSTPSKQPITNEDTGSIPRMSLVSQAVISDNFKHIALYGMSDDYRGYNCKILSHNSSQWHEHVFPGEFCDELLAFSPDAKWLLAYKKPSTLQILETSIPHAVLELQFPKSEYPFSSVCNTMDISYKIATRFGTIGFGKPDALDFATRIGWGMSFDKQWIMRDNERMIWVPLEYRDLAVDTHGSRVAFSCPSGTITMMKLEQED